MRTVLNDIILQDLRLLAQMILAILEHTIGLKNCMYAIIVTNLKQDSLKCNFRMYTGEKSYHYNQWNKVLLENS